MKYISFCLYDSKRAKSISTDGKRDNKYIVGAMENIRLAKTFYPDWTLIFYTASDINKKVLEKLKQDNVKIEVLDETSDDPCWMFYRMLVIFREDTERFIIRDCDSRINRREVCAVNEWEQSGKPLHIMRDHPFHTVPVLGGMWGGISKHFQYLEKPFNNYLEELRHGNCRLGAKRNPYGDQKFLKQYVWNNFENNHIAHDDRKTFTGNELDFFISMKDNHFVGQAYSEHGKAMYKKDGGLLKEDK